MTFHQLYCKRSMPESFQEYQEKYAKKKNKKKLKKRPKRGPKPPWSRVIMEAWFCRSSTKTHFLGLFFPFFGPFAYRTLWKSNFWGMISVDLHQRLGFVIKGIDPSLDTLESSSDQPRKYTLCSPDLEIIGQMRLAQQWQLMSKIIRLPNIN